MVPAEQEVYARWLSTGTLVSFAALSLTFAVYAFGLLDPLVPPWEVMRLWGLPTDRFVAATGSPSGWGWLGFLSKSDYLNHLGVVSLVLISIVCYARIIPVLPRAQAILAALQILVLLAAALFL